MFVRLILLFQIIASVLMCRCGSGSDIGNPDITGRVLSFDNGKPVSACKVVLGPLKEDPGIVTIEPGKEKLIIVLQSKRFKTVYTDTSGIFRFDTVGQGAYCIYAGKDNLMGIFEKIYPFDEDSINVGDIEIKPTSKLTIDNYSSIMDTSSKNFVAARIDGTDITSQEDIKDRIYFSAIPEGVYDIILYRGNKTHECIKELGVKSSDSSITIQVNPATSPEEWTYHQSVRTKYPRPYVLKYSFEAAPIPDSYNFKHYCWIQFSHDMETRITGNAIKAFSSDSLTKINKIQWQGSNQILVDLCTNGTNICTDDTTSLKKGVTYSIVIDTTARTIDGYTLAWPDTLKLTP
jgi:hypothetical protein